MVFFVCFFCFFLGSFFPPFFDFEKSSPPGGFLVKTEEKNKKQKNKRTKNSKKETKKAQKKTKPDPAWTGSLP